MFNQPFTQGERVCPIEMPVFAKTGPFDPTEKLADAGPFQVIEIWHWERDKEWLVRLSGVYGIFFAKDFKSFNH